MVNFNVALWDVRFMRVARLVAGWSKDPSTKVGVVLVRDRKIVATGYNGFPSGIADDDRLNDREQKYPLIVHAEMNAILQAGSESRGSTLYCWGPGWVSPCQDCVKHLITVGVHSMVYAVTKVEPRWSGEQEAAALTLREANIDVRTLS